MVRCSEPVERMMILFFLSGVVGVTVLVFGRYLGEKGGSVVTVGGILCSWFLAVRQMVHVVVNREVKILEGPFWIKNLLLDWVFLLDSLSVLMMVIILTISLLVHLYSIEYMKGDPHLTRFLGYLSLFTFFMVILVTANNFLQLFVGWEGVGLCSYLLINFWFTRKQANKSALKAMVVNRFGDIGLMISFCLIYNLYKSLDFSVIFLLSGKNQGATLNLLDTVFSYNDLIVFFLVLGAIGKSAQIGLHLWLPDAMEGPTPVSALIHAATMVTAGVYLVVRCSIMFESSAGILYLVGLLGGLTSLFAASTGLFQNDLKKVIAYSTCSQLGYMFLACSLSGYDAAMFHLFTHAFFKALLFLGAGGVIHSVGDEQDLRRMGGLLRLLPLTYTAILIGSLSLMGMPFLSGFYSKELILELAASRVYLYMLGVMSAFFTGFYSIRLIYLVFLSSARNDTIVYKNIHEVSTLMGMSYLVLIPSSIFVGYLFKDLLVGLGTNYWNYSVYVNYENQLGFEAEFLPYYIKLVPLFFGLSGGIAGYLFHKMTGEVYIFLIRKWYLDEIVNKLVSLVLSEGYKSMFKGLDRGIFEVYGPTGIAKWLGKSSEKAVKLQTGYLYHYIGWILFGLFTIVTIAFLGGAEGILIVGISLLWLRLF